MKKLMKLLVILLGVVVVVAGLSVLYVYNMGQNMTNSMTVCSEKLGVPAGEESLKKYLAAKGISKEEFEKTYSKCVAENQ